MELLKIYQVYYRDEQLPNLDYTPYKNEDCTVFFENSIIAELIPKSEAKYLGVVSWNLRPKIKSVLGPRINITPFYPETFSLKLDQLRPDVMGFCQYDPHDPIKTWCGIHPELQEYFRDVLKKCGHEWRPKVYDDCFYSNAFVAKSEVYKKYVSELLIPAMGIMNTMPKLMNNSGYPRPLPIELRVKWGISYYPYHSFICERLFSYWSYLNKLNVKYY